MHSDALDGKVQQDLRHRSQPRIVEHVLLITHAIRRHVDLEQQVDDIANRPLPALLGDGILGSI